MSEFKQQEPVQEPLEAVADKEPENKTPEVKLDKHGKPKKPVKQEVMEWIFSLAIAVVAALLIRTFIFEFVRVDGTSMLTTLNDREIMFTTKYDYWLGNLERFDVVILHYPSRGNTTFVKRIVGMPGDTVELQSGYLYVNGQRYEEPYIQDSYRTGYSNSFSAVRVPAKGDVLTWDGEGFLVNGEASDSIIAYGPADLTAKCGSDTLAEVITRGVQGTVSNAYFTYNGKVLKYKDGVCYLDGEPQAEDPLKDREFVVTADQYFVMGDHRNGSNDSRAVGPIERSLIRGHVRHVIFPFSKWRGI